jgi:hypothetical protein
MWPSEIHLQVELAASLQLFSIPLQERKELKGQDRQPRGCPERPPIHPLLKVVQMCRAQALASAQVSSLCHQCCPGQRAVT